jgi:hypothetical protein
MQRATRVHVKRQPEASLSLAAFEERHGDLDEARAEFQALQEMAPGLVAGVCAFANFERRCGDVSAAKAVFEEALSVERAATEGITENTTLLPYLWIQCAPYPIICLCFYWLKMICALGTQNFSMKLSATKMLRGPLSPASFWSARALE